MPIPSSLQTAQTWPIKAQGAINRLNPLGDPDIEHLYHKALEQGRHLETSIADAQHWLLQKKDMYEHRIQAWLMHHQTTVDGELPHAARVPKYVADAVTIMKTVNKYQQEIAGLVRAVAQNIFILTTIKSNMIGMVQTDLNAIANLLNNICNWGLPTLASIPNLLSGGMFKWNGFQFSPIPSFASLTGTLGKAPKFSFNFSFSQCNLLPPGSLGGPPPTTVSTYSGITLGTTAFVPPLVGPVYDPAFNTNDMLGSVPDPAFILNDYQMPAQTYQDNIVSIVPATRIAVTDTSTSLRATLVHFVTLAQVVDSNFDPNTTAEWLLYLNATRTGRGGSWIRNFQTLYTQVIAPSVSYLQQTSVPWNNSTGTVQNAPTNIPFIATLVNADPITQLNLLWKLSYIEASLLGYTRNARWDAGVDASFLSDFTGSDLDYRATPIDPTVTSSVTLGVGTAEFPVECTFPSAIAANMAIVIARAANLIAITPGFQSPHPQFRFTFDSFSVAQQVDRFTQFWREFNANLQVLLVQDPYLLGFTVTYTDSLDSAVDPLGDSTDYGVIKTDVATRNRLWTPGTPLLNLPVIPIITVDNNTPPTDATNGWTGLDLDPVAFLARPDIQSQPIPVQLAMLRTNLSFAAISKWSQQFQAEIDGQIANANALIASSSQVGFQVEASSDTTVVPADTPTPIEFDQIVFDNTGNVTNVTTFTIQADGAYAGYGEINWSSSGPGQLVLSVMKNGESIFSVASNDPSSPLPLSFINNFVQGDVVQVIASNSSDSEIVPGAPGTTFFSMLQTQSVTPPSVIAGDMNFLAGTSFPALTVLRVGHQGEVKPIDPVNVIFEFALSSISSVHGTTATGITSIPHGFTPGQSIFILDTAHFDGIYTVQTTPDNFTFTVDSLVSGGPETGNVNGVSTTTGGNTIFPFADGVALNDVIAGGLVPVATSYGGAFQLTVSSPVLPLEIGKLLYVGPGGLITQDYETLTLGQNAVRWIVCVGRAISVDTFMWEPHIPSRFNVTF